MSLCFECAHSDLGAFRLIQQGGLAVEDSKILQCQKCFSLIEPDVLRARIDFVFSKILDSDCSAESIIENPVLSNDRDDDEDDEKDITQKQQLNEFLDPKKKDQRGHDELGLPAICRWCGDSKTLKPVQGQDQDASIIHFCGSCKECTGLDDLFSYEEALELQASLDAESLQAEPCQNGCGNTDPDRFMFIQIKEDVRLLCMDCHYEIPVEVKSSVPETSQTDQCSKEVLVEEMCIGEQYPDITRPDPALACNCGHPSDDYQLYRHESGIESHMTCRKCGEVIILDHDVYYSQSKATRDMLIGETSEQSEWIKSAKVDKTSLPHPAHFLYAQDQGVPYRDDDGWKLTDPPDFLKHINDSAKVGETSDQSEWIKSAKADKTSLPHPAHYAPGQDQGAPSTGDGDWKSTDQPDFLKNINDAAKGYESLKQHYQTFQDVVGKERADRLQKEAVTRGKDFAQKGLSTACKVAPHAVGPGLVIGVEGYMWNRDLQRKHQEKEDGKCTEQEYLAFKVRRGAEGGIAMAGGAVGGMLGSRFIPIPVVGNLIGSTLGGLIGKGVGKLLGT